MTAPATSNKQTTTTFLLDGFEDALAESRLTTGADPVAIEDDPGGDLLWLNLEKTVGPSNTAGIATTFIYRAWCDGEFINE